MIGRSGKIHCRQGLDDRRRLYCHLLSVWSDEYVVDAPVRHMRRKRKIFRSKQLPCLLKEPQGPAIRKAIEIST